MINITFKNDSCIWKFDSWYSWWDGVLDSEQVSYLFRYDELLYPLMLLNIDLWYIGIVDTYFIIDMIDSIKNVSSLIYGILILLLDNIGT